MLGSYSVVVVLSGGGRLQDGVSSLKERLQPLLHSPQLGQHLCQLSRTGVTAGGQKGKRCSMNHLGQ